MTASLANLSTAVARRAVRWLAFAAMASLLAACDTQLVSSLSERDGNEVLAILLREGVDAAKGSADGGKTWSVSVDRRDVVRALELLRSHGLPRARNASLGDMFRKDGLVSTPVEERVRFVYGVGQELAETLMRMDGVVVARVHIVLPQNDPLARPKPSSASVFVKHRHGAEVAALTAPIRNLVAHAVEGLDYDAVSVVFVEAEAPASSPSPPDAPRRDLLLPLACLLVGVTLPLLGLFAWRRRGSVPSRWRRRGDGGAAPAATAPPSPDGADLAAGGTP